MTQNIGQFQLLDDTAIANNDRVPVFDQSEANLSSRTKAILAASLRRYMNGGVDVQRSATKPITRSDGGALVSGDRWYDTTEGLWFFWNGTYWLSEVLNIFQAAGVSLSDSGEFGGLPINTSGNNLFLVSFTTSVVFDVGTFDASNFWIIFPRRLNSSNAFANETAHVQNTTPVTTRVNVNITLNAHRNVSALDTQAIEYRATKTGTPPSIIKAACRLLYRWAKP